MCFYDQLHQPNAKSAFHGLCDLHAGNLLSNSATPSCHSQIPPVVEALHIAMSLPSACSAFLTCCSPGELNSIYQQSLFEGFTKLDVTVQLNVAALYAQLCHIEAASQSNIAQGHKLPLCKVMLQDVQVFDHCLNVIVGKVGLCALSFLCMYISLCMYTASDFVLTHAALSAHSKLQLPWESPPCRPLALPLLLFHPRPTAPGSLKHVDMCLLALSATV